MKASEIKPKEYVLLRNIHTDQVHAVSADSWNDYKWEMKPPRNLELVVSGEKGYLTMLEQLADDKSTKDYV